MPDRVATWSLRRRFALIAAMVLVASSIIGGAAMYWVEASNDDEIRDARLEQSGAALLNFAEKVQSPAASIGAKLDLPLNMRPPAAFRYRYQIWSQDGALLLRAPGASATRPLMALPNRGFATVDIDNAEYRVFAVASGDGTLVVQVAENTDERWLDIAREMSHDMAYLLVPYGILAGLAWLMLRRAVRGIEAVAHQLEGRNPFDLSALRIANPPRELLPTLIAIDSLFARIGQTLSSERQFTSAAAHEMRTPLAGLRAHAQLASAASDDADLQEELLAIRTGVDRASHLIDQLLDLARLEEQPAGSAQRFERVNVSEVYEAVMVDLELRASAKQTRVSARIDVDEIHGHRGALSMLLRNLIANAILYSPAGTSVDVCFTAHEGGITLTVDDAGPGIRPADRQTAFERFNRLGQSRVGGVGLGLSIVLSAVNLHRAHIQLLDSPLGGLRVQVEFPAASRVADLPA